MKFYDSIHPHLSPVSVTVRQKKFVCQSRPECQTTLRLFGLCFVKGRKKGKEKVRGEGVGKPKKPLNNNDGIKLLIIIEHIFIKFHTLYSVGVHVCLPHKFI